jgi:hypothetical protein
MGPERPKWVKSISPKASSNFFSSMMTLALTFRKLRPWRRGAMSPSLILQGS